MDVALLLREPLYATCGQAPGCGTLGIIQSRWGCKQDDEADICRRADDMQAYLLGTKLGTVSMALFTEGATVQLVGDSDKMVLRARHGKVECPGYQVRDSEYGSILQRDP